jgi:putative redox protein
MTGVVVTSGQNFQNTVVYNDGQAFTIDEPVSAGGDGTGPDPYTLLLAAIGGCTSMTVSMYARRKGWQLERLRVELSQARVYTEDCASCEAKPEAFIHQISVSLQIEGDLTDEQRARLLDIATKCPVKKTLTAGITVKYLENE